jgi:hypothetical protein
VAESQTQDGGSNIQRDGAAKELKEHKAEKPKTGEIDHRSLRFTSTVAKATADRQMETGFRRLLIIFVSAVPIRMTKLPPGASGKIVGNGC